MALNLSAKAALIAGGEGGLRSHEPVFHDWHVSTVLPSAGLGDFSNKNLFAKSSMSPTMSLILQQNDKARLRFRINSSLHKFAVCAFEIKLAEGEGFDPPCPFGTSAFKADAFANSAIPPKRKIETAARFAVPRAVKPLRLRRPAVPLEQLYFDNPGLCRRYLLFLLDVFDFHCSRSFEVRWRYALDAVKSLIAVFVCFFHLSSLDHISSNASGTTTSTWLESWCL